jgi:hypothetical protein
MSFEPRNSEARRRRIAEGRAHVAAVVATACLLGTAGVGVPAVAQDGAQKPALSDCPDPARDATGATADGVAAAAAAAHESGQTLEELQALQAACAELASEQAGTGDDGAQAPTTTHEAAPTAPPAAPAADPSTTAPATEANAPSKASGSEPSRISEAVASRPTSAPKARARDSAATRGRAGRDDGADAATTAKDSGSDDKSRGKAKRAAAKKKATPEPKSTPQPERGAAGSALTYASLPASWTSLAPLSLPDFSVDGFPIPPFLLPVYQAAAAHYGVPWEILASINEIETDFGRNAKVSSAGALGWMQFMPSSWKRWGKDGDADGKRDPRNPIDAIFAAGRYLYDAGAATDLPKAIFAYNHADWYVEKVIERAREFAGLDKLLVAALTKRALREDTKLYRAHGNPFAGPGAIEPTAVQALLLTKRQLTRIVLRTKDIALYPGGRADIAAGHIDRRVLATLLFLERSGLNPTVTSLTTGHSLLTSSGNVSAHSYGHAVDISAINGVPILGHQGPDSITAKTLKKLVQLQGFLQPNQIISLMTMDGHDNTMSMGDHADHIHVGFPRVPDVPDSGRPTDVGELVAALRARTSGR